MRKKKKRRLIFVALLLLTGVLAVVLYINSYTGKVKKGYALLKESDFKASEEMFQSAIRKNPKKADAYWGLMQLYMSQSKSEKAEALFIKAIPKYPEEEEFYRGLFQIYFEIEQPEKITEFLSECESEHVLKELKEYVSEAPKFSLEKTEYENVQELELDSKGTIYYTTDGSAPTMRSKQYKKPIHLSEGETIVKAISVNEKGVPSLVKEKTYTIQLPVADAPTISPSTGQYHEAKQIIVQVPAGYTAYYTMDGSEPTEKSQQYREPIEMPEGDTLFSVILIDAKGRSSETAKRHYNRVINE